MKGLTSDSALLLAPADRPAGRRGMRGPIAATVAIAALPALIFARAGDEPSWGRPVWLAAAAALIAGAILLWTARRPVMLGAALALVLVALSAAVVTERIGQHEKHEAEKWGGFAGDDVHSGPRLSRAEADAVPKDLTRAQLVARLGTPGGRGIQRVYDEPDLPCLLYRTDRPGRNRFATHAFCFSDGRYVALREW
jgi:hypothetical protein